MLGSVLLASLPAAQESSTLDLAGPVARQHPLAHGLLNWWRVLPGLEGTGTWYDLMALAHGTLTNMTTGGPTGWGSTMRTGGAGELRFDGSASTILIGEMPVYDFVNHVFTVTLWVRSSALITQYLIAKRLNTCACGGWFLRLNGDGTLTARVLDGGNVVAAQRITTTSTLGDGAWHHVAVVFATDTAAAGANDVTIMVDGQLNQGSLTANGNPYVPCQASGCPLMLGAGSDSVAVFQGALDDVRVYNRGLSVGEIQESRLLAHQGDPGLLAQIPVVAPFVFPSTLQGSFAPFFQ